MYLLQDAICNNNFKFFAMRTESKGYARSYSRSTRRGSMEIIFFWSTWIRRSCLIMDAPIKHVITWVSAISFSYFVMSRIVNTPSPRDERSRGHVPDHVWDASLKFARVRMEFRYARIYRYRQYVPSVGRLIALPGDLRNLAAAGLTAFTSTPCLRPRLATWFVDNTMTFSYLRTLSGLSFHTCERNAGGSIAWIIVGLKFAPTGNELRCWS